MNPEKNSKSECIYLCNVLNYIASAGIVQFKLSTTTKYDNEDIVCHSVMGVAVFIVCLCMTENLKVFIASCSTKLDE